MSTAAVTHGTSPFAAVFDVVCVVAGAAALREAHRRVTALFLATIAS